MLLKLRTFSLQDPWQPKAQHCAPFQLSAWDATSMRKALTPASAMLPLVPLPVSAHCRQQGKACSDDIKVFSRALPWEAVGQEKGVRVFIARALAPGEAPPATPAAAAKLLVAKGPKQQQQQEELSAAAVQQQGAGQLSRKQRKLRERAARIRALQEAAGGNAAAAAAAGDAAGDALDSPQQSEDASRDILVIIADQDTNKQQQQDEKQQQGSQAAAGFKSDKLAALASDEVVLELAPFKVGKGPSWTAESNSSSTGISSSASTDAAAPPAAGPIPRIHACIVLDPVYSSGRVIGYTAERSFLHPRGVKGAVKLLQRHALALLRAEGYSLLNLGLAVGYEVKPGVWGLLWLAVQGGVAARC